MCNDSDKERAEFMVRMDAVDRHARREQLIKSRSGRTVVKAADDYLTMRTSRILDSGEIVEATLAYRLNGDGQRVWVGWVNDDGTIEKIELREQQPAEPATRAEVSADSAAQQADRDRIRRQYELE